MSESLKSPLRIETLAIGDEILTGRIADTNSTFVANHLFQRGLRLNRQNVVPDEEPLMIAGIEETASRSDVVICFGGLGPTSDDKTAEVAARLIGSRLVEDPVSKERLLSMLRARGRGVSPQVLKQVLYPELAKPLSNSKGAAPGFHLKFKSTDYFFLPGVPSEMRAMFEAHVLPFLDSLSQESGRLLSHCWRCLGIWESELQKLMDPIEAALPKGAWLGYRTKPPENYLTLYYRLAEHESLSDYEAWKSKIRKLVGDYTYTEQNLDLEELIHQELKAQKASVALAESCTGGLTVQRLTRLPGASGYVWGGFVTYQTRAKAAMLGVEVANDEAAVSAETSRKLAFSTREKSGCEVAGAVTGVLGPTGDTEKNPLGTIYACAVHGETVKEARHVIPLRSREEAQWAASTYLLALLYDVLKRG